MTNTDRPGAYDTTIMVAALTSGEIEALRGIGDLDDEWRITKRDLAVLLAAVTEIPERHPLSRACKRIARHYAPHIHPS